MFVASPADPIKWGETAVPEYQLRSSIPAFLETILPPFFSVTVVGPPPDVRSDRTVRAAPTFNVSLRNWVEIWDLALTWLGSTLKGTAGSIFLKTYPVLVIAQAS